MVRKTVKNTIFNQAINHPERKAQVPTDKQGQFLRVSEYFGENVFNIHKAKGIPREFKTELMEVIHSGKPLSRKLAEVVANALLNWATSKGVTHFCHWFQPLTGATAEKHDSFLNIDFDDDTAIETLSASQLMQGEPDASSFPHGGARSTFEARGYTSWDLTSPIFIMESTNGKTLCIPTAFVSYLGDALDKKIPLLRSLSCANKALTKFVNLTGNPTVKNVHVTVGAEQEYFLIDKGFFYSRPDLVMCGRTLMGSLTPKNQQLEDHYFGAIEDRVLSFMQELEIELYRLGIPAKTRHNEVAPGQYEIAQIFREANVSADQNQVLMVMIKRLALKHNFVALLHEKPFSGINGSGKHVNWSMADDLGNNLLEPGKNPQINYRFLAVVSIILEAVHRHADVIRMGISGHANDFRLGANEAPPSIISVFLGDTLEKIFSGIASGQAYAFNNDRPYMDMGATQLAQLLKDNTDRNRTSPFAFTGNKFEFRAVGSSAAVGFPTSILLAAVTEVVNESNEILQKDLQGGKSLDDALVALISKWVKSSHKVIFNGDGYKQEWVKEAQKRGLPNLKNTAEALQVLKDSKATEFLTKQGIYSACELETRHNVLLERYNKISEIEYRTLESMVNRYVLPACFKYKKDLISSIERQKNVGVSAKVETEVCKTISALGEGLYDSLLATKNAWEKHSQDDHEELSFAIANELIPLQNTVSKFCNEIERIVPEYLWELPTYYDMLFIR